MSCKNKEKKISDLLDGKLSDKQRIILERHLSLCSGCKDYKNQLETLRSNVRSRERADMPRGYALEFSAKLWRRLQKEQQHKIKKMKYLDFEKWAYGAAGLFIILFLALYLIVLQPAPIQPEEYFMLSFEDALGELMGEINDDPELEELFNSILAASLDEAMGELDEKKIPLILESFFYEEETLEVKTEIREPQIKKDTKS